MAKFAVVKTGGKQFVVKANDEIVVNNLSDQKEVDLEVLATFNDNGDDLEIGSPTLEKKAKAQIIENGKGEKIRVARFKSKVRYRRVKGFRPQLTKIKILAI
ncbi:MAG: 50S ribosomal protein L21 [Candidatus Roizmanbacteria bacterium]|nr:MAG: 50S ribosomal protein L21 [Candidatus Roizmanbacteria bacterium]